MAAKEVTHALTTRQYQTFNEARTSLNQAEIQIALIRQHYNKTIELILDAYGYGPGVRANIDDETKALIVSVHVPDPAPDLAAGSVAAESPQLALSR
jgi:hypothetical protein